VLLQLLIVALVPLNVTHPDVVPKLVPVIVTDLPDGPEVGDRLVIDGDGTVNVTPLLETVPTPTTTLPVVAPPGTVVTMEVLLQLLIVALVPLNVTHPDVVPKLVPVIVTDVPDGPEVGDRLVIDGDGTVNVTPLLETLPTPTTTAPVFAPPGTVATIAVLLQLLIVAYIPLNVTHPDVVPKLVPVIVTGVPTGPEVGDKLVIVCALATTAVKQKSRSTAKKWLRSKRRKE